MFSSIIFKDAAAELALLDARGTPQGTHPAAQPPWPRGAKEGVHCVDLVESFPTHIDLQHLASIQLKTSPDKFLTSKPHGHYMDMELPADTESGRGQIDEEIEKNQNFNFLSRKK